MDCIEKTGQELTTNNHDIVKYICDIEEERKTLDHIIQRQYEERKKVEAEIERLTYKLCLINKSLSMRIKAKNNYDKTLEEITAHYAKLVDNSNKLKQIVEKSQQELDDLMNKKTGTCSGPEGDEVQMIYVKPTEFPDEKCGSTDCPCSYTPEIPTKDRRSSGSSQKSDSSRSSSPTKNRRSVDIKPIVKQSSGSSKDTYKWDQKVETMNNPLPPMIDGVSQHSQQVTAGSNIGSSDLVLSNYRTETEVFVSPTHKKPQNYFNACEGNPNLEDEYTDTRGPSSGMLQAVTSGSAKEEETKKIILARIKTSIMSSQRATDARQPKILTTNEGGHPLDVLPSEAHLNKLQKRSLHDILNEK